MNDHLQINYSKYVDDWLDWKTPPVLMPLTCPTTKQEVVGDRWRYPHLTSGQIVWWHCPECQGWHVLKLEMDDHQIDVNL